MKIPVVCKDMLALIFLWTPFLLILLVLANILPPVRKKLDEYIITAMDETSTNKHDNENIFLTLDFVKAFIRLRYLDIFKEAFKGYKAPNPKLLSIDGSAEMYLLDVQKQGRPLVLNFGSCTWPPFVEKLARFNEIIAEFCDAADFLLIYIEEAHPTDGWSFKNNFDIKTHRSIGDRLMAAKKLSKLDPHCPIMVDKMDDNANKLYGALFERLYIVLDNIIVYEGEQGPHGYKVEEIGKWLKDYLRS